MDDLAVQEAISHLRKALADPCDLRPELRAELEHALHDVERALGPAREATLGARIGELATRFEVTHPALAESVASLARTLAAIGI